MKLKALALAVFMSTTIADAQMVDFAVEVVDYFADEKVEIVDYFADEKWEVVGACTNSPNLKIEFVDYFADMKVEIVDYFADRKICITNAEELDRDLLERLGLIN